MFWLAAILALSLLIIIHEFGHYVCARMAGMHVDRFSVIGIGPVVLRLFTYKGTEFVLSAIPFGAYVHIVGMEAEDNDPALEHAAAPKGYANYRDRPLWARAWAIAGGPLANYGAAMLIMASVFIIVGMKEPYAAQIQGFGSDSPAQRAGLQEGDLIVSVAGEAIAGDPEQAPFDKLNAITSRHLGQEVDIVVERGAGKRSYLVTLNPGTPALSTSMMELDEFRPVAFTTALNQGIWWPIDQTARQLEGLWRLITRQSDGRVGGPVAIVRTIKAQAEHGILEFVVISALISTVLGMFNLLPLPALDGGRLLFLGYELVARAPASRRIEEMVHATGMICLLGLIAFLTIGDIRGDSDAPQDPGMGIGGRSLPD